MAAPCVVPLRATVPSATLEFSSNAGISPATVTLGGESMEILADEGQPGRGIGSDDDGSGVLTVQTNEATAAAVCVSPNPAAGCLEMGIILDAAADLRALPVNSGGEVVRDLGTIQWAPDSSFDVIDLSGIPAGAYAIRLSGPGFAETSRFVVAR